MLSKSCSFITLPAFTSSRPPCWPLSHMISPVWDCKCPHNIFLPPAPFGENENGVIPWLSTVSLAHLLRGAYL
ncbi:hypothetical protein GGR52DRAFT_522981 [Hypoxylon sp. FL1284]|nr:hypothetical protein GGR52DRAFT_522981 [Hypoxylon sp. FL1284]